VEWIVPEMFTEEGIREHYSDIIKQKETAEFKLTQLTIQVDEIKKMYFKELFVYERMKETNPNLVPNVNVLKQLKELERDPTYKDIKMQQDGLKLEIKRFDEILKKAYDSLDKNFKFDTINYKIYLNMMNDYIDGDEKTTFENVMEEVFGNEFGDKKLYKKVALQRGYDVINLLVEKAPDEQKTFFKYLLEWQMEMDTEKDLEYIELGLIDFENPENDIIMGIIRDYENEFGVE
jgi:hypothetical protein